MDTPSRLQIERVVISPNDCGLSEPVSICIHFSHSELLEDVRWRVRFSVDTVSKKRIVDFGETPQCTYQPGHSEMLWTADQMQMPDKLAKALLNNVGLLVLSLLQGDSTIVDINFVTSVSQAPDGSLRRNMMSPI